MKNKAFTLIELLVVITIIGILVSLLLPALKSAMTGGKAGLTAVRIDQIRNAVNHYKLDYGVAPKLSNQQFLNGDPSGVAIDLILNSNDVAELVKILSGQIINGNNSKKIIYLNDQKLVKNGVYVDAWGEPLMMALDSNYDGMINIDPRNSSALASNPDAQAASGTLQQVACQGIAVWSWGNKPHSGGDAVVYTEASMGSWIKNFNTKAAP